MNFPVYRKKSVLMLARCLVVVALFTPLPALSQEINALKAAYLFYFSKFVSWPPDQDRVVVCVKSVNDEIRSQLRSLEGKKVGSKSLHIEELGDAYQGSLRDHCNVLYSNESLDNMEGDLSSVLIVTDEMHQKTVIAFKVREGKLSFDIHAGRAHSSGIKISSRLMRLAGKVYQ